MNQTSLRVALLSLTALALAVPLAGCPKVPDADPLEPAPHVVKFTASAGTVAPGSRVTLTWNVENATSVKIEDVKLGAISGVSDVQGTVETAINDETLFVLTARNARGASDTAVVVVHVGASDGELLFTALPGTITAGDSVTLAWSAPGATAISIVAAPGGMVDVGTQLTAGSVVVSPTANTTYTLTAGTRTATAQVQVKPTLLNFTASADSVDAGATITLTWDTANATRVQITAPGRGTLVDEMDAAKVAHGTFDDTLPSQVDPGQYFSYELTATGAGTTIKKSVVVSVSGNPVVTSFTAPDRVRSPALGNFADGGVPAPTMRLAWTTLQAIDVIIARDGVDFYRAPPTAVTGGSLDLPVPAADTTFTLRAAGPRGGTANASRTVKVVGAPTVTLTATPGSTTGGSPVTLSWQGTNVLGVQLSTAADGVVYGDATNTGTGSTTRLVNDNTSFTLTAFNGLGDSVTSIAAVSVTSPLVLSVVDTGTLRAGQDVSVSWTAPGPMVGLAHDRVDTRARAGAFDDISTTGTALVFGSSNVVAPISTTFRTTLFGKRVGESIWVSKNGYLTFGDQPYGGNSTDEALPTQKLEPYSVAPYWESLTFNSGTWAVETVAGVQTLVVQWNMSTATFQARIAETGQIDFEYLNLPTTISGHSGVTGRTLAQTRVVTAIADAGVTFFGPVTSPATVKAIEDGTFAGAVQLDAGFVRLSAPVGPVVKPSELGLSEVLAASTVGVNGQWAEVRNARDVALDLSGWNFALSDGGTVALSGSVPGRGVLVLGASNDPSLNDDAGVSVQLSGFDFTGSTSFALTRAGAHDLVSLAAQDAGVAFGHDVGPFLPASSPTRCITTATFGSQVPAQKGTPGRDTGCGFPYMLVPIKGGFYEIADAGTPLMGTSFDSVVVNVDLSSNPFPYFGTPRTSIQVSSNGFASFDTATVSTTDYLSTTPSTTDANAVLAIYAGDLDKSFQVTDSQIYSKRVGANEDPFAAAPHWIIEWHDYSTWSSGYDVMNFQLKLFDDGTIEYHYGSMLSGSSFMRAAGYSGTTWLENPAGTQALVVNVQSYIPGIAPNSAFRFVPR
ncbi:MAG: hypothetical protein U0228_30070 [Myxococcaceae bacterium]